MLLQNKTIYAQYPVRFSGGATGNERSQFGLRNDNNLNRFVSLAGMSKVQSYPPSYSPGYAWGLQLTAGGIGMINSVNCSGEITFANLAGGKNLQITLWGSGDTTANLALIVSAIASLVGSGNTYADIIGKLEASSTLTGSSIVTGALGALAGLVADIIGQGTISDAGVTAKGNISANLTPFTELSPQNLAAAVWESVAVNFDTPGSMGEKLNNAASAGDPWGTAIPSTYVEGTAGYIVGNYLNMPITGVSENTINGIIETGITLKDAIRLLLSISAGKTNISGITEGAAVVRFRDINDSVDRVTATLSGSERTSIVINKD